jgi:hypothetical protein
LSEFSVSVVVSEIPLDGHCESNLNLIATKITGTPFVSSSSYLLLTNPGTSRSI